MLISQENSVKFSGTIKELAEKWGVEYIEASGLITFLKAKGKATKTGRQKTPSGKGKPSDIYEMPSSLLLTFTES